jgi:hypothetical protein
MRRHILLAGLLLPALLAGAVLGAAPRHQRGAPPPAAAPQPQPKGTGIIAGQVIDASTNQPIGGATVSMNPRLSAPRSAGPGPASPVVPIRLITGADGRFVIHDLSKGSYVINANADGYLGGTSGQARPGATSEPIDVGDGERVTDVRIRLWRSAVITGTVVDEAGEPAVVTPVRVYRRIAVAGRVRYTPTSYASTDDRGVYRASGLSPGDYIVAVPQTQATMPTTIMDSMLQGIAGGSAPISGALMDVMSSSGGAIRGTGVRVGDLMLSSEAGAVAPASDGRIFAFQTVLYPAAVSLSQASLVTLKSGEERSGIDLQLRLAPTFRLSGTVSFPGGTAGMLTVRLTPAADDGTGDLGFDVATAATRPDGTFTFLGVPPGQFFVRVIKPPRPAIPAELANNPMVQMAFGGGGLAQALYGEVPVTVGSSDINDIAIVLNEGVKLTGRMVFDGALPPPQAQQLRSISITLQAADGRSTGAVAGFQQTIVEQDATFKTPNYPAGKYLINAGNPGPGWMVRSIVVDGRDVTNEPFDLRDDLANVVVTYTDKVGQVNGIVHAAQGVPIASGSTVFMFPADYRARIANADARRFRNAAVSKTGAYTFGGLAAGEYLVAAMDGDDVPDNRDTPFFDALARVATHVTIGEGEKKTQDLPFVKVAR